MSNGSINVIKGCPPPTQGGGRTPERVCIEDIIHALEDMGVWCKAVVDALKLFPPDTCVRIPAPKKAAVRPRTPRKT